MSKQSISVVLGIGCDRGTARQTLESAIEQALAKAEIARSAVGGLATIDKKSDEAALLEVAERTGWPLHFFSAEQLAEIEVPNPSEVVRKYMGTPAVAEAAAMLLAQADMSELLVEKHKYRGEDGKNATVSVVNSGERIYE